MTKHDRFEWIEEYASCPRCDSEDLVAFTEFHRLSNDGYHTRFNLRIECDECESVFIPELFKTQSSTQIVRSD